jgi:hypothetical protein
MSGHPRLRLRQLLSRSRRWICDALMVKHCSVEGQAMRDLKAGRVNATANQGNR